MIMMRKKSVPFAVWFIMVLNIAYLCGCAQQEAPQTNKYRESKMLMGTEVQIDVCQDQHDMAKTENAYRDVWKRLEDISWRMNVLDEHSDVAKINNSNLRPVVIGTDTYRVIKDALYYSRVTNGAFDITVWPLIYLWRESEMGNIFPTQDEIREVQANIGFKNIQLMGNGQVKLLNSKTKIDLGGIAKGYAVDEAARIFREQGITSFFIDAGGDIYAGGLNCDGELWRIGIRDPQDRSKMIDIVKVTDMAVVTSGDYEQFYEIQNQRWSHIINPITGYPQKGVISATVIAPSAMEADAMATALCVLGGRLGTDHVNALNGSHASLIIAGKSPDAIERFSSRGYSNFQYKK